MKRLDLLIAEARASTGNQNYTADAGVQDAEFIRAFNDGQDKIQSLILNTFPSMFQKRKIISAVQAQETYDNPVDVFLDSRIEKLEYSQNGDTKNYYKLQAGFLEEEININAGAPSFYIRQSKTFLCQPPPQDSGGSFRMTYQRAFPRLDKRRGKVSAVTLDTAAKTITALTIDPTLLSSDDATAINEAEYITVVSKDGTIKMQNIPVAVDSNSGVFTIDTFVYGEGETIAVGDWVVTGKYATTTSELSDICERFLLKFCEWRILKRDSNSDSMEQNQELIDMANDIVESYKRPDSDVKGIPILDTDYLDFT